MAYEGELNAAPADAGLWTGRKLYKVDSNGNMRVWFMQRDGHKHRVVAGVEGGSLVENAWTECVSKGKGKAQTTPEEQAIKEVDALYRKGLDRDYYETPEEAKGPPRNYLPMLAESYKDTTWEKWTARLSGVELLHGETGVYFQPKLDGYCCIAKASGLQSREGLPIRTAPHIEEKLRAFFAKYPDRVLHGELYNHDLKDDFEKLGSLLKTEKDITPEHAQEVAEKVQYHIYDYPGLESEPYGVRSKRLYDDLADLGIWCDAIQFVPTVIVRDAAHLKELTDYAIKNGYEGGIGRLHLPYEKAKRSHSVQKIKHRMDAEFDVVRIEAGKGNYAGYAKRVICWVPGADRSAGPNKTNTFGAGIKGDRDQKLADLLHEDHKVVTLEFFSYTKGGSGVPRQGVAIKWHGAGRQW